MPNRKLNAGNYRYGFNGKENDLETGTIDFGVRGYDPRIARWNRSDNVRKPFISTYQFSQDDPINYVDPDGNDEIHFRYVTQQNLDAEGKTFTTLKFYTEIVKDGKEDLVFFVGNALVGSKEVQIKPFIEGTRIANDYGNNAAGAGLPGSHDKFFFSMFNYAIDDYTYLGILLNANPDVVDHYKGTKWEMYLKGSQKKEASRQVSETLETGVEITYTIIDGFYIVKGIGTAISSAYRWKALFSATTITRVSTHLERFGIKAENEIMLERMEQINNGTLKATEVDVNFMKHEVRESELMEKGYSYETAHEMTLKEQGMYQKGYETKLYTQEAIDAGNAQMMKEATGKKP